MPVKIFCCYARKDQQLLNELKAHLTPLQRQGLITLWADTDIGAGTEWEYEINKHLDFAQIILLLISPDFMASEYCYSKEMKRAMVRHERGEAHIIPVILRPVYWQGAPFGKLQALPSDGKPVTDPEWHNLDRAFFNVVESIVELVTELSKQRPYFASIRPLEIIESKSSPSSNRTLTASSSRKFGSNEPIGHLPPVSNTSTRRSQKYFMKLNIYSFLRTYSITVLFIMILFSVVIVAALVKLNSPTYLVASFVFAILVTFVGFFLSKK